MSEEPENLILHASARIREPNDPILSKLDERTFRVSSVERELADLKGDFAGVKVDMAANNQWPDNLERRHDLVDAAPP